METIKFTAYDFKFIPQYLLNKMVELQTVNGQFIPHFITFDEDGEIVCATPRKIDNGFCIGQGEFDFDDFCLDYVAEAKDRDRAVATLFNAQALILLRAREVYLKIGVIKEVAPYWFNEMLHLNSLYEHHVRMLVKHRDLYERFFSTKSRKLIEESLQDFLGIHNTIVANPDNGLDLSNFQNIYVVG